MITTAEIKKKAERIYPQVLRSVLTAEIVFPQYIRSDKSLSKDFVSMGKEIAHIIGDSKDRRGFGYSVVSEKVRSRLHGTQDIPKAIMFESQTDFLKYVGKVKEFETFNNDIGKILSVIPELKEWCINNTHLVITNSSNWEDLIKVCLWFMNYHDPGKYYIRELPISIHTKFIESNIGVLRSLLDELIPHLTIKEETLFQKRFGLKYEEPRIRLRFLDNSLTLEGRFTDISLPLSDFVSSNFACKNVLITENLMNFLTLPNLKDTIAIWGGGYAVKNLKGIEWLKDKQIFYWGDLDIHGFEILSQLRSYYNHTTSLMMDETTFEEFNLYQVSGSRSNVSSLGYLTEKEARLYEEIRADNLRLEQEKIPQSYVNSMLQARFDNLSK